jgi:hypothetical protein
MFIFITYSYISYNFIIKLNLIILKYYLQIRKYRKNRIIHIYRMKFKYFQLKYNRNNHYY